MLDEDELKDAALCVFANKQDMPGALSPTQVGTGTIQGDVLDANRNWPK